MGVSASSEKKSVRVSAAPNVSREKATEGEQLLSQFHQWSELPPELQEIIVSFVDPEVSSFFLLTA